VTRISGRPARSENPRAVGQRQASLRTQGQAWSSPRRAERRPDGPTMPHLAAAAQSRAAHDAADDPDTRE